MTEGLPLNETAPFAILLELTKFTFLCYNAQNLRIVCGGGKSHEIQFGSAAVGKTTVEQEGEHHEFI